MKELIKIKKTIIGEEEVNSVSARELYNNLGLEKAHWSRWGKQNITDNKFAIEHEDWEGFTMMVNGNETSDFMLKIEFAKKLAMQARTTEGENVRNYFIECEKKLKQIEQPKQITTAEMLLAQAQLMVEQDKRLTAIEKRLDKKADIEKLLPDVKPKTLRANLNEMIRSYSQKNEIDFFVVWQTLYKEFYYRNNCNIILRAKNKHMKILDYAEQEGILEDIMALALELFL